MQDIRETLYIILHASKEELGELLQLFAHAPDQVEAKLNELRRKYAPKDDAPLWKRATPEELKRAIHAWAEEERPPMPVLTNEALRRENLYD